MDLWHPPTDQPHLLDWYAPLLEAGQRLRQARYPWLIHIDEMVLTGRVDRGSRPSIWVYKHTHSRGELYLDDAAQAYKFTRTPNARSYGRFTPCDLTTAIWRADMPKYVDPVFYDEPPPHHHHDSWEDDDPLKEEPTRPAPEPRRRGHLRVIEGGLGRPLAG